MKRRLKDGWDSGGSRNPANHGFKTPTYCETDGSYRAPQSGIDAMYLHAAAVEAKDFEAAAFFEDEARRFAEQDLADGV